MKHTLLRVFALIVATSFAEPVILPPAFSTRDAPEVTPADHDRPG